MGISAYRQKAGDLSRQWQRSRIGLLSELVASRLFFGLGPNEFDDYQLQAKPVREWRGYVPEERTTALQRQVSPERVRGLEEDKLQFWQRCVQSGLPTIPILAVASETAVSETRGPPVLRTPDELAAFLRGLGRFSGFIKPVRGGEGYGAFGVEVEDGAVLTADGRGDARTLFERCLQFGRKLQGSLLQPRLRPHNELVPIMPGPGVGSFRLVTFRGRDGRVEIPWATVKSPGPGAEICHSRLGAVMIPIDVKAGRLARVARARLGFGATMIDVECHPETQMRFDGLVVPYWQDAVELAVRGAHAFSELPCLGWDLAITPEGPLLVETNWNFGFNLYQIAYGCGLGAAFEDQVNRCRPAGDGAVHS